MSSTDHTLTMAEMSAQADRLPLGKFCISSDLLRTEWRALQPLFAQMVVVRAQAVFPYTVEYTALSSLFAPCDQGIECPTYTVEMRRESDDSISYSVRKQ